MSSEKIKVLFLCRGNACRSQMAEGWARELAGDVIEPYSAGIAPIGVSSTAAKVMAAAGVDISSQRSKCVDEFAGADIDFVITLCSHDVSCPVFAGQAKVIHHPFEDPYFASGTKEEIYAEFVRVRDLIKAFVKTLPRSLKS